jgi:hypothetical protein
MTSGSSNSSTPENQQMRITALGRVSATGTTFD